MRRSSYRDQDLVFGQLMLKLRMAIGLTQAGLADFLHVTRRAVGGWEAGESYPKANHLKQFIALALRQHAFTAGREAEEIRDLWRAARQKVLLDEQWLETLLAERHAPLGLDSAKYSDGWNPPSVPPTRIGPRLDWNDAPDIPSLFGRDEELAHLTRWIVDEQCRIVCVVGMGGIGKSALTVACMRRVALSFESVLWRSLNDTPSCEGLLDSCLQVLAPQSLMHSPDSLDARLHLLMEQLRSRRVLLVLDNWEVLLEEGTGTSRLRAGFESYARLLQQIGGSVHQSCLILTSREKPVDLVSLEGNRRLVRVLKVAGLDTEVGTQLLAEKELGSSEQDRAKLIELYGGNPLALKIVAQTIIDVFGGDISLFLAQGDLVFGGVRQLLDEQFSHLSTLEQNMVYWLAILREPATLEELLAVLRKPQAPAYILEALDALNRRSMIEQGHRPGSFTLHSVVLEYATTRIVAEASRELVEGTLDRLIAHSLSQARGKNYIRKAQEQLLLLPVLEQLRQIYPEAASLETHLLGLLDKLRSIDHFAQGYGPSNLLTLLRVLRRTLRGLDLSHLALRNVSLQGVDMQDASLVGTTLRDTTFTEAFDAVRIVVISSDGQRWAVGSRQGEVRIWNEEGKVLHLVWQAHLSDMTALAFSPDGRTLASVSFDNTVKLWNVETGALVWTAQQTGSINAVTFAPNGLFLASASNDGHIHIWDAQNGESVQLLAVQGTMIGSLAWSPDGTLLAGGCGDGTIWLWEPLLEPTETLVRKFPAHDGWVSGLAFHPAGRQLASAGADGDVKLWDTEHGHYLHTVSKHSAAMVRVAWSTDGRTLATCSFDHLIWLWDAHEWQAQAILHGHTGVIYGLSFAPDNLTLISGSDDGTIRIWDVAKGLSLRIIGGYVATLLDVDWSPDGTRLAAAGTDTLVTIWNPADSAAPLVLRGHRWIVQGVAWNPTGHVLASGGYDNSIGLWDTATGVRVQELHDPDATNTLFFGVVWSPDGKLLASGSYQRGVHVWDVAASARRWVGQTSSTLLRRLSWSPDGTLLAGAGGEGVVYLWDALNGTLIQQLAGHARTVTSVAWNPDGSRLASVGGGTAGGELFVWHVQQGEHIQSFAGHPGIASAVVWNPNGEVLISGGSDGVVRWWDIQSGQSIRAQQGHRGTVQALKVSPSGRELASCGDDGAIVIWNIHTGEKLHTLRRDRPYERMDISGLSGITDAQRASLIALGAVERQEYARQAGGEVSASNQPLPLPKVEHGASSSQTSLRNLPFQPTTFIGRDAELAEITTRLLDRSCRLLTLLGPGGIGKTQLALEVAAAHAAVFADGVVFVALASVDMPSQIASAINDSLGFSPVDHPDPTMQLLNYLREKHMLLVLDNFEHILDGADLIATMLAQAPNLSILVTSRERLQLQAEWLFNVGGLAYPAQLQNGVASSQHQSEPSTYSAVQLFIQRAMQVQPALVLDEEAMLSITRICQHVAGMPLAIELAAAGAHIVSLVEIEQQIRTNLDALETTLRDVPARHRSLRVVFEHSWKLLDEDERAVFSRLAVFRGGWSAQAAAEVVGATLPVLAALADKSLVRQSVVADTTNQEAHEPRWTMLESLREYALDQLATYDERETIQHAHAHYFVALTETVAMQWGTATFAQAIAQLRREYDNIRAALAWARDSGDVLGLELAGALWQFWRGHGYVGEGRAWLRQLLAIEPTVTDANKRAARLRALHAAAWLASDEHDYEQAATLFAESLELRRSLGDTAADTDLLINSARQARAEGKYQQATALLEQALAWQRAQGQDIVEQRDTATPRLFAFGQVLYELGLVLREQGDFMRSTALYEESVAFHRAIGHRTLVAIGLLGLADVARDQGDGESVWKYGEPALHILREFGMSWAIGFMLNTLALGAYYQRDFERAEALIRESEAIFRDLDSGSSLTEILITLGKIERARGNMAAAYTATNEALQLALAFGPRLFIAASLEGLGTITAAQGQAKESVQLLALAAALRQSMGAPVWPADKSSLDAAMATGQALLDTNTFTDIWTQIYGLELDELLQAIASIAQLKHSHV